MLRPDRHRIFFFKAAGACLLVLAASAPPFNAAQDTPRPGGVLRVRPFSNDIQAEPRSRPGVWVFAIEQLFDGLVGIDGRPRPRSPVWPSTGRSRTTATGRPSSCARGVRFHHGRGPRRPRTSSIPSSVSSGPTSRSPFFEYFITRVVGAREFREGKAAEVSGFRAPAPYVFEIRVDLALQRGPSPPGMSFAKVLPKDLVESQGRTSSSSPSAPALSPSSRGCAAPASTSSGSASSGTPAITAGEALPRYPWRSARISPMDHFRNGEARHLPLPERGPGRVRVPASSGAGLGAGRTWP